MISLTIVHGDVALIMLNFIRFEHVEKMSTPAMAAPPQMQHIRYPSPIPVPMQPRTRLAVILGQEDIVGSVLDGAFPL